MDHPEFIVCSFMENSIGLKRVKRDHSEEYFLSSVLLFALTCLDILERLGMDVIPYIVLLIVPVLGRMSDQNQDVRTMATHCFATLIRLLPLEVLTCQLRVTVTSCFLNKVIVDL